MRHIHKAILATAIIAGSVSSMYYTQHQSTQTSTTPTHIAPDYLYPDPTVTPGKVDTSDFQKLTQRYNGQTYSQHFRNVPDSEKKQVCNEYPDNCKNKIEIDHFCPIALGCSNDIQNLWAQPEVNVWNEQDFGFHTKDRLEVYMVEQMKAGAITPKDAQTCILNDWVACYQKYLGNKLGAVNQVIDPDSQ